jgi:hypothetical protein
MAIYSVQEKTKKIGIFNIESGEWFIPMEYESVMTYYTNPFIIRQNNKWGFVDSISRKPFTKFKFDDIEVNDFNRNNNGFARTKIGIKHGVVTRQGKEIVPAEYGAIEIVNGLFFARNQNGK